MDLKRVLWLGYLAPPNAMPKVGSRPVAETRLPTEVLKCGACGLAQLGWVAAPEQIFPPEYPYRTGTTRALREHFAKLASLVQAEFVVDIGSNDGTLLGEFQKRGARVWGIEPTDAGKDAIQRGIPTDISYFDDAAVERVPQKADLVTACNVFAHIPDPNAVVERIVRLLAPEGTFISESHWWGSIVGGLQYDTVYHEHLRYYTLTALKPLLARHGLECFHVESIPTHGGSIRVWAARKGQKTVQASVKAMLKTEQMLGDAESFLQERVEQSRSRLHSMLETLERPLWGIGAPSRAATLVQYTNIPLDAVAEVPSSPKIGLYIPGTLVPVRDEAEMDGKNAVVLSWHIASEVTENLRKKGYRGRFVVPLPRPEFA